MVKEEWVEAVVATISATSRTSVGETSTAYNGAKPALRIRDPHELQSVCARNLQNATEHVWEFGRQVRPDALHVRAFCNALSARVSDGLLEQGVSQLRTWDTRKRFPLQVPPEMVAEEYQRFCHKLATQLPGVLANPAEYAAHVERDFNRRIHPLADGCGRVSRLLGAWMLLRHDMMPAQFTCVQEYYAAINAPFKEWVAAYSARITQLIETVQK